MNMKKQINDTATNAATYDAIEAATKDAVDNAIADAMFGKN